MSIVLPRVSRHLVKGLVDRRFFQKLVLTHSTMARTALGITIFLFYNELFYNVGGEVSEVIIVIVV